jgi:hypothetical protein
MVSTTSTDIILDAREKDLERREREIALREREQKIRQRELELGIINNQKAP